MPLSSASSSVFSHVEHDLQNKKFSSALKKLSMLSVEHSKNINYLNYLAETLRGLSDVAGLIKTLRQILKQSASIEIEIELMKLLYKNGQINEALDVGLSLQPKKLTNVQLMNTSFTLIKIFIEENDFDGVEETILQVFSMAMHHDFIFWAQGLVHVSRSEKNKALTCFRKAVDMNPLNDQAWVSLALLHYEMGDEELALANLEAALDCNPLNNAAVKLYSQWSQKIMGPQVRALRTVQFYLSAHEFDEEISLCHVQLLCRSQSWREAGFEIQKLIMNNPQNLNYYDMKKNLEQNLNM